MKSKLLIVELWGLGDLVIATPFLRAVAERFTVTLLAKPYALDLQPRLWPGVRIEPIVAPWTTFTGKYRFWRWPWRDIFHLRRRLMAERFDFGLSARWDPRDHLLLKILEARNRLGFPRLHSQIFLTQPCTRPDPQSHRYESWRALARVLNVQLPPRDQLSPPAVQGRETVLIHSGAGQPVRVWPLERYRQVAARLRQKKIPALIVCDPDQRDWWLRAGEAGVATPSTVAGLLELIDRAKAFIGNDSGPGHLAAFCGVPTFTIFGPQLPEWFAPLHPAAAWIEGKACPYLPCSDYCRFPEPHCLWKISEPEVWSRVEDFLITRCRENSNGSKS